MKRKWFSFLAAVALAMSAVISTNVVLGDPIVVDVGPAAELPAESILDTVSCLSGDSFPCNVPVLSLTGNSIPFGGGFARWVGFVNEAGTAHIVGLELVDSDGATRRVQFTPDGLVDLRRMVDRAGAWLDFNDASYTTVVEFPGDDCPACTEPDDPDPEPGGCANGEQLGESAECCVPFGEPCNALAEYCCPDNTAIVPASPAEAVLWDDDPHALEPR